MIGLISRILQTQSNTLPIGVNPLEFASVAPHNAALALGFFIAVIVMGILTVQVTIYSGRSYNDHTSSVIIVNMIVMYNCISLAILGHGQYHSMITIFGDNSSSMPLTRRYVLLLVPNFISRSIASYGLTRTMKSLDRSRLIEAGLKLLLASRLAVAAVGLQAICASIGAHSNIGFTSWELSRFVSLGLLMATISECIVCALFCVAVARATASHAHENPGISRIARYMIPAYSVTVSWQLLFAIGIWCRSTFMIACFGIPLAPVSNAMLLAILHAHPSALETPPWRRQAMASTLPSVNPRVSVKQDITTTSCHDGPLEIELTERLERQFPEEEESRSYRAEPNVSSPNVSNILREGEI